MEKEIKTLLKIIALLITLQLSCTFTADPENPNTPPETTLANIPVTNDTLFSLVELQWDGGDNDGYILGYEYRYHTKYVNIGDSIFRDEWTYTEDQKVTLAFDSKDLLNNQHFQFQEFVIMNSRQYMIEPFHLKTQIFRFFFYYQF